jgi:nucleotide sugar dehydrogenase
MSSTLQVKPEDINVAERRARYRAAVVGCDLTGVFFSYLLADAGFRVTCVDADQTVVALLAKGRAPFTNHEAEIKLKNFVKNGRIVPTNDTKTAVSQSEIILINAPVRVDRKKKPDYSVIQKTCRLVGASLLRGAIVMVTVMVGVGAVENMLQEILEDASGFKVGTDIGLAYAPIQTSHDQNLETALASAGIVAACDKNSLNVASAILETVAGATGLKKTLSVKSAEMAVLFRAAQTQVSSGLGYEFAFLCEKARVDCLEVRRLLNAEAANTASSRGGYDRDTRNASYLLLADAEDLNTKLRAVTVASETDEQVAKHATYLVSDALRSCGKTLRRAKISMLGVSETPNVRSPPKRLARRLAKIMERRGAKLRIYDPYFSPDDAETEHFKKTLNEALEGVDCILLVTAHDQLRRLTTNRLRVVMKMPGAIVDLEGVFEPEKVEKEGLVYRGLGRGVWTK